MSCVLHSWKKMRFTVCAICCGAMLNFSGDGAWAQKALASDRSDKAMVGHLVHAKIDMSWIFEPILYEHMMLSPDDVHDAQKVIDLARVAEMRGIGDRVDVRSARRAADQLVLAEAARRSLIDSIKLTDADVAARVAAHPGRYDEYRLRHIFIAVGPIGDGKTRSEGEALKIAEQLRARIMAGERFESVAQTMSEDKSTAAEGGALSEMLGTTMNDAFYPYVSTLSMGAVTQPVRGPQGFHLIKLDERKPATTESARYCAEQDAIGERLPGLISAAIAALPPSAK